MTNAIATANNVEISQVSELFILKCARGGFTTHGFDVVLRDLKHMNEVLNLELDVQDEERGTIEQYQQYLDAVEKVRLMGGIKQTWFEYGTDPKLKWVLEKARKNETRVRIFCGNPETGRDWLDEYDVMGTIGRSTGLFKVPLLIPVGEDCGSPISSNVLRVIDVATGHDLYRHPNYQEPKLEIRPVNDTGLKTDGYTHETWHDNGPDAGWLLGARFKSFGAACNWVAFMTGNSMTQP